MQAPTLRDGADPLDILCYHFNVKPTAHHGGPIGPTFAMSVRRDARMPTHVLAVTQSDSPSSTSSSNPTYQTPQQTPIMFPIDAERFANGFRTELNLPPMPPGTPAPIPQRIPTGTSSASSSSSSGSSSSSSSNNTMLYVTLPVIPLSVPHIRSLALLLLYGMKLETELHDLAWRLLPPPVVQEFPSAPAMALTFSRYSEEVFNGLFRHNQGIWRNSLFLGLDAGPILQNIQIAWNVSNETRRLRQRAAAAAAVSGGAPSS